MPVKQEQSIAIQRLTALWALSESGLGGLMHAFNSSFTGLVVGSISILLISLICLFSGFKWSILTRALLLVLIVKFMVSPHSQITAYIAVSFQAVSGYLCFKILPRYVACFVFPIIALLESAFQRIFVLAILFGETLANAIDSMGKKIGSFFNVSMEETTMGLIIGYGILHICIGVLVGYFCYKIYRSISSTSDNAKYQITAEQLAIKKVKKNKGYRYALWFLLLILSVLAIFGFYTNGLSDGIFIIVRTLLIITIWYFLISPLILKALRGYLSKKQGQHVEDIESIFSLFPYLSWIVKKVVKDSSGLSFFKRVYYILYHILMYSLYFRIESDDIYTQ